jgi:hypothetical protein
MYFTYLKSPSLTDFHDIFHFGLDFIRKMYFSHWKPPGVSERMWSVTLDASISEEYQTLGRHSCQPSQ